ncbi:hypothetical protein [Sphingomonas sp. SRS2]|uniref:hypothetical protein n=1 Tax=Sphingomonas sp. SRS2 TaxID=133190 RepID=UPI0006184923|nr:hypothetical protein [Sphingomonas sp. SRS2]KKC27864.1 hypothetical protein WP12_01470 [Sphingomonas sp. SRS2]
MANAMLNMADYPEVEAQQRPVLRLVDAAPKPKMAPPSWMLAPPIPAEIRTVSVNEPQQPYLPLHAPQTTAAIPAAPALSDAPYRNIREVPRLG